MRIHSTARRASGEKIGRVRWNARVRPVRGDRESGRFLRAVDHHLDRAAARNRRAGQQQQIEEKLHLVLRQKGAGRLPDELGFLVIEIGSRDPLGGGEIDARPGRARGAEGEAGELEPRRGARRALTHELESVGTHRLVLLEVHHLEPIDDGPHRADDVVADTAAQKGGKVERFEFDVGHLTVNNLSQSCSLLADTKSRYGESLPASRAVADTPWEQALKGTQEQFADIKEAFIEAALAAGKEILARRQEKLRTTSKADGSPVTDADLRAEEIIRARLGKDLPGMPIIGEEGKGAAVDVAGQKRFILVDPLDGTRDFLDGSAHFTVNIALIENRRSIAGVLHAPALGRLFVGDVAHGAYEIAVERDRFAAETGSRRALRVRSAPAANPVALESRSHREPATESLLEKLAPFDRRSVGSSLKFALIAAGEGDFYARGVSLNEWDIAAGDAVLSAAGGAVVDFDDEPVLYGNARLKAPPFIALGDSAIRARTRRIKGGAILPE